MKKQIFPNIWIADLEGCTARLPINGDRVAYRVHACKHPCHQDRVGQLDPSHKHYLIYEQADETYMNLIDTNRPLFQKASFDHFLRRAREHWTLGRPLLIHCNHGRSRAPTLALLFMAKCIKVISDASYDDAWDDFEKKCGMEYTPGAGIEQWMRENWAAIQDLPAAYIAGVASPYRFTHYQPPDTSRITNEEGVALVAGSPLVHFSTMVTIEDKKHEQITPKPNILQMRFDEAYQIFRQRGIPIRLIALKPRQVGCSTIAGHLCYHHSRNCKVDGLIIGDEGSRTMKVWQIFTEYAQNDVFPWNSDFRFDTKKAVFEYSDGTEGRWEYDTANDPKAGISGTRQVIWYTEAARYARTGSRTDVKVMTASMNSLAKTPNSMAIAESTADGANGWFFDTWQGSVTLEDFRKGKYKNGWVQIFAAWFEFHEHTVDRTPENEEYFKTELSPREKRGVSLYNWDARQIAWRRKTIQTDCAGDERIFDQDFPEDDRSCFISSGRPRFNEEGVTRLEMMAQNEHDLAERGVLETDGVKVDFIKRTDDPWLWVSERPKMGCSYIAFIDPCMGEQSRGARNPDAHAAGILRATYLDEHETLRPAELVAAIDVPTGCRWDDSLVAERLVMLANYYGGCMIVPETGNGLGVLVKLRDFGANIYQRHKEDSIIPGKRVPVSGWETTSSTRDIWVGAMADAIRDQERAFNCRYKPAVAEMRTFIVDDRGKAQAKNGAHDDWIAGIGIGLACIRFAGAYFPPTYRETRRNEAQKKVAFSY